MADADDSLRNASNYRDLPLVQFRAGIQDKMRARIAKIPGLTPEREARAWALFAITTAMISSRAAVHRT